MKSTRLEDIVLSVKEKTSNVVMDNILSYIVENGCKACFDEACGSLIKDVFGAICPFVGEVYVSYKQKRLERNVYEVINQINERQDEIEEELEKLYSYNNEYIRNTLEVFLDNIIDEIQADMVKYNTNAFINIIKSDNVNDNVSIMFFKTLSQLNELDIRILKLYGNPNERGETIVDICNEYNMVSIQVKFIKEKLARLGLLENKNDKIISDDLDDIIDYFKKADAEKRKHKPKEVKIPNLKKISSLDLYKITSLGNQYLNAIER